ncbi:MAG UNVERIFIED_CONTAM: MFS transporter [Planctomycetaceae bacterium]|jgi:MFS family permease
MSKRIAFFIWIIVSVFYAYQYVIRVMPNIMLDEILTQFNIDTAIFGQFSGIYYIGYSLMHMPIGIMFDRFGPKKVLPVCMIMTSIGLTPIIFSDNWLYPLIGRLLIGIGSSAAILGVFKIIRIGFKEAHFTRMLSLSVTIGLMGAIYGGGPVSYMSSKLGYKTVVEIFAITGLVLASIAYFAIPQIPRIKTKPIITDIKTVFSNKKVILLCCFAGLMVGPLEGFADVWGAAFLKQIYNYDTSTASYLTSMIFVGMCFGAPVLGLVAERTDSYIGTITSAGLTMCIAFTALIIGALNISSIAFSFTLIGICSAYQILAIYKASTYVPEDVSSLTTAVANMIIMLFGYGFHTVIGLVVSYYKETNIDLAFTLGISVIPGALLIGSIGFIMIWLHDRSLVKPV